MSISPNTKSEIQEYVQNAFGAALALEYVYEDTRRKAGYIVPGSPEPRDLIDEGGLLESLDITSTLLSVTLSFSDNASIQLEQRPEVVEEILENLPRKEIVADLITSYLRGKL